MSEPATNIITHDQPSLAGTAVINTALPKRASAWNLLVKGRTNKVCLLVVVFYLLVGIAGLIPGFGSNNRFHLWPYGVEDLARFRYNFGEENQATQPSLSYTDAQGARHASPAAWFGTDFGGHSVFWRLIYGARTALLITILTSVLVLIIGVGLGVIAGYFGGWIDDAITWFYAVLGTIPWILLVTAVSYVLNQNVRASGYSAEQVGGPFSEWFRSIMPSDVIIVILALGLTDWVGLCRLIRGETIKLRDSDMVSAARALGLSEFRIVFRHIMPNVSHLAIISFTLGAVGYLQVEVVLAFLGIGVKTAPSWGRMIDDAKLSLMRGQWWELTAATAAIFVICIALNLLGDALRDALDPKVRGRD
jgi:ABC-type dipeptide/oligopeptide/nickel transport system permease subunit